MEITLRISELMTNINKNQELIDEKNSFIDSLKSEVGSLQTTVDSDKAELLSLLQDDDALNFNGLVAQRFHKPAVGYTKDSDVLNWLKTNFDGKFIKVKTTESLDKNPLKKELKTNVTLQEGLKPFILSGNTDYVVVTTEQNYQKMLEHIEGDK